MGQTYYPNSPAMGQKLSEMILLIRQNFATLRESFYGVNPPSSPVIGQLWYDTTNNLSPIPKFWTGYHWVSTITGDYSYSETEVDNLLAEKEKRVYKQATTPLSPISNDLWISTGGTPEELRRYNGLQWLSVGGSAGAGITNQKLILPIPYSLYAGAFNGNIFFRLLLSKNQDLSAPVLNLDTGSAQIDWKLWTGSEFQNLTAIGFPTTYEGLFYLWTEAERNINYYGYWQAYQGVVNGDKIPIIITL